MPWSAALRRPASTGQTRLELFTWRPSSPGGRPRYGRTQPGVRAGTVAAAGWSWVGRGTKQGTILDVCWCASHSRIHVEKTQFSGLKLFVEL